MVSKRNADTALFLLRVNNEMSTDEYVTSTKKKRGVIWRCEARGPSLF